MWQLGDLTLFPILFPVTFEQRIEYPGALPPVEPPLLQWREPDEVKLEVHWESVQEPPERQNSVRITTS